MSIEPFLTKLRLLGVHVWLEDDHLRFRSPSGVMNDALKREMKSFGRELRDYLGRAAGHDEVLPDRENSLLLLSSGEMPALFCIHSVSGGATYYRKLRLSNNGHGAPPTVYGISARGLDLESPPLTSVSDMADAYSRLIKTVQPSGPYFLCGYSMGGMIAYDVANRLLSAGNEVPFIGLFDTQFTESRPSDGREDFATWTTFMNICLGEVESSFLDDRHAFWLMPEQDKLQLILHHSKRGKSNLEADFDLPRLTAKYQFFHTLRAAASGYCPAPSKATLTYFRATDTPTHEINKWRELVGGRVEVIPVNATHLEFFTENEIAAGIGNSIAQRISAQWRLS